MALCLVAPYPALATAVTNCNDSGAGSLRQAIIDTPDAGTIDATGLAGVCSVITVKTGELSIGYDDLTIAGPGADRLVLTALLVTDRTFHHYQSRIFSHTGRGTLTLKNLSVSAGLLTTPASQSLSGGCILSSANVSLINTNVYDCRVTSDIGASGGAIVAGGSVYLSSSRVTNNIATGTSFGGAGGGISAGTITARQSTVAGNTVSGGTGQTSVVVGGGLRCAGMDISNSTISGNTASGGAISHDGYESSQGGGIYCRGITVMSNSTVSGNSAAFGAGLFLSGSSISLTNSTIAFNSNSALSAGGAELFATSALTIDSDIFSNNTSGPVSMAIDLITGGSIAPSGSHNLVFASPSPLPAGTLRNVCPFLAPLGDNGGSTQTHRLWSNSPAIDVGDNSQALPYDQRGPNYPRTSGNGTDIGSYEINIADEIFGSGLDGC
jgi:hypothetical protein